MVLTDDWYVCDHINGTDVTSQYTDAAVRTAADMICQALHLQGDTGDAERRWWIQWVVRLWCY